jgi:hypothetical protein
MVLEESFNTRLAASHTHPAKEIGTGKAVHSKARQKRKRKQEIGAI